MLRSLALWSLAAAAHAQVPGGSLGLATDDVFRGLSQNDGRLSPQGDLHAVLGSWYAGLSAQEVRRGLDQGPGAEVIVYAGLVHRFGEDFSARATLRHYDYPGNALRTRYDYDEFGATLGWRERLMLSAIASPDTYSADYRGNYGSGAAYCFELAARQPLPRDVAALAGVGYYDLRRQIGTGYAYWSAGLSGRWGPWAVDLRYVGTDSRARDRFEDLAGNRLVLSGFWLF